MKPEQAEKLLGGYATATLTDEERAALFQAALGNQALFDALADEEGLRELLSDPAARRRLLEAVSPAEQGRGWLAWIWRPLPMGAAAGLAAAAIAVVMLRAPEPPVVEMARFEAPAVVTPDVPAPVEPKKEKAPRAIGAPPQAKSIRADQPARAESDEPAAPPPAATPAPERPAAAQTEVRQSVAKKVEEFAVARLRDESAPAPAAYSYRIERRNDEGQYVPFTETGPLRAGDRVRLRLEMREAGLLSVALGVGTTTRSLLSARVEANQTIYVPRSGELPSEAGEKVLVIRFTKPDEAASNLGFRAGAAQSASVDAPLMIVLHYRE
jgi:hypothetical protein